MSGNATFSLNDTAVVSVVHVDAPEVVTSAQFDEMLADTYDRVRGAQPGMLESLAGMRERRWWPEGTSTPMRPQQRGRRQSKPAGCAPTRSAS